MKKSINFNLGRNNIRNEKMKRLTFLLIILLIQPMMLTHAQKVRIACVGNSITYGAYINNREKYCYPAQLQTYLGEGFEVRNFGLNGATLLLKGDLPYMKSPQYEQSLDFLPDIVIIKLGTNDTKPRNWEYKADFMNDYKTLIESYRALSSNPRIILLTPLRCFLSEDTGINSQRIAQDVRSMVEETAFNEGLDIVNMYNVVGDTWDAAVMPDRLHPSSLGAGSMALKIYKHLNVKEENIKENKEEPFYKIGATIFNFHGFQGYDFESDGVKCKVVEPHVVANGKPWIWRARFWGHEPQTDIDLLERGFHVAYCDVADLFGSPQAVKRWDTFYRHMVKEGFSRKMALEGMSRGGLIIYNWAAKNPKKVACIYADAPVMDITQWPMALEGEKDNISRMMKAYGFKSEEEAISWKGNPVDHARKMARAAIPILHVVGDMDEGVRYQDNTKVFEERMKELGAPIRVIHKPSIGHHPHSLSNPQPIVDFILQAMNQDN